MLERVFNLKEEIGLFMSLKGKEITEFDDPEFGSYPLSIIY